MLNIVQERDVPPLDRRAREVASAVENDEVGFYDALRGAAGDARRELFSNFPNIPSLAADFPKPSLMALDFSSLLQFRSFERLTPEAQGQVKAIVDEFIELDVARVLNELRCITADCQPFDLQKNSRLVSEVNAINKSLYDLGETKNALAYAESVLGIASRMYTILPKDMLLDIANSSMLRVDNGVLEAKVHRYYGLACHCIDLINLMTSQQNSERDNVLESRISMFGESEFTEHSYRMKRLSSTSEDDREQMWASINELVKQASGTSSDHLASKFNLLGDMIVAVIEHLNYAADNYSMEASAAGDQGLLKRGLHCLVTFMQNLAAFFGEVVNGHALTHALINQQSKLVAIAADRVNRIKAIIQETGSIAGNEALQYQGEAFHAALTSKLSMFDWGGTVTDSAFFNDKLKIPELIKKFTGMNVSFQIYDTIPMPYATMTPPPLNPNHPYIRNHHKYHFVSHYRNDLIKNDGRKISSTVNVSTGQVDGWYSEVPFVLTLSSIEFWAGYTARELSAVILHEIGHGFMMLYMMNRRMADFSVMDGLVRRLADVKDKFVRRDMIVYDLRNLGIEVSDQDRMTSDEYNGKNSDVLACALYVDGSLNSTSVAEGKYSLRINEQLADQFAMAHGAGPDLASAIYKLESTYSGKPEYIQSRALYWTSQVFQLFFVLMLPVFPLIALVVFMDLQEDDVYDGPLKRIELMRRSIIGEIKRYKNDPRMMKRLSEDAERIRQMENLLNDRPTIVRLLAKLVSPARRRVIATAQKHANIERIIGNDLFLSHTRFN